MLILISALLPVAAGILLLAVPACRRCFKAVSLTALALTAACVAAVCIAAPVRYEVLSLGGGLSFAFGVDGVSRLFAALSACAWLLVGIYAVPYLAHDAAPARFYGFYLVTVGMLMALDFAANLVTMYFCFELVTLCSVPLVLHELTKESIAAALKFLFYSIAGALMGLLGIFILYHIAGTEALSGFTAGGVFTEAMVGPEKGLFYTGVFVAVVGFGAKAGLFPLHGWLPTAHPVAPAPASAVLSGVITKAGVLAILRLVYCTVGADMIRGTWVQTVWLILCMMTVFMGSMLAYREKLLKKRLAYSTVSQVSYILLGMAFLHPAALLGALMHVIFHSCVKNTLFMSAGAIIHETGCTRVDELTGIGKRMPVTMWCFALVSVTLVGIPPTSAFLSKWYLATGALDAGCGAFGVIAAAVLLISALLTAGYLFPIVTKGFFPGKDVSDAVKKCEPSPAMWIPMLVFTLAAVGFGIFPNPLTDALSALIGTLL